MVAHVGDVEIFSAVVSHSLRRVEERRQRLAVLISLLRRPPMFCEHGSMVLFDLDRILKGVDLLEIFRIIRINKRSQMFGDLCRRTFACTEFEPP